MLQVSGWTDEMTKRVAEYEKEKALHGEPVNQSEITSAMLPLMLPNGKGNRFSLLRSHFFLSTDWSTICSNF